MENFENPYWSLLQVIAWISTRDKSIVSELADGKSEGTVRKYVKPSDGRTMWVDEDIGPPSRLSLAIRIRNGTDFGDINSAEEALLSALVAGRLTCEALKNNEGDPQVVPVSNWAELKFHSSLLHDDYYAVPKDLFRAGATQWHRLRFVSDQVLSLWEDPEKESSQSAKHETSPREVQPPLAEQRQESKNKRRRRQNEVRDDELVEQLQQIKIEAIRQGVSFPVPAGQMRRLAKALEKSSRIKLAQGTIRQILGGYYEPAARLVREKKVESWWLGTANTRKLSPENTTKARGGG